MEHRKSRLRKCAAHSANRSVRPDRSAIKRQEKEIKDLNAKIDADQKQVTEAQTLADSLPKTVTSDVIRPYQYSRKTLDIKDTIKLQFRIGDTLNSQMGDAVIVAKDDPRQYVLIET